MTITSEEALNVVEAKKVLVIGPPKCGKSCLIKRAAENVFEPRYLQTFGADLTVLPSANP